MEFLSVAIITWNEERNIERCIRSVQGLADEIVVIDSFSTDRTAELCRMAGVRFEQHPFEGYIEQKNYALERCTYNMVLALDADEALSPELFSSILAEKESGFSADGYTMNRLTSYLGRWVKHSGWYPDRKLRLFDRRKAKWGGLNPHDKVIFELPAKIRHLEGDLLHYSYHKPEDHSYQIEHFSAIGAKTYFAKGRKSGLLLLMFAPLFKFLRDFVLKLGLLDGYAGLRIARLSAKATFLKYLKLRYLHKAFRPNVVIISRTDGIGDVVLTLPVCALLKQHYPQVRIVFLAKPYTMPVLNCCTHIDEVMDADALMKASLEQQISMLHATGADTFLHVFPRRHFAKLAKKSGIKHRIGASGRWYHYLYANHIVPLSRKSSDLHEAQLNIKLLMPLGIINFLDLPKIRPLFGLVASAGAYHPLFKELESDKFNLIIHPKSKGSAREWPLDRFSELVALLPPDEFKIFVGGTAAERDDIAPLLAKHPHLIDTTGQLDLIHYIEFIARADGLVAASTGPLHLAAALGRIAIGVYPAIRPIHPGRWKPIGPWAEAITYKEICNDCKKLTNCACMQQLEALTVAQKLNKLIHERNRQMAGSRQSESRKWQV